MIITDTDFANQALLERVKQGETIEVQEHGQTVAAIVPRDRCTNKARLVTVDGRLLIRSERPITNEDVAAAMAEFP